MSFFHSLEGYESFAMSTVILVNSVARRVLVSRATRASPTTSAHPAVRYPPTLPSGPAQQRQSSGISVTASAFTPSAASTTLSAVPTAVPAGTPTTVPTPVSIPVPIASAPVFAKMDQTTWDAAPKATQMKWYKQIYLI